MSEGQMALFAASDVVARMPGWQLIATSQGTQGFHLVDRTTPDRGVVTVCGITGRTVRSDLPGFVPCATCAGSVT